MMASSSSNPRYPKVTNALKAALGKDLLKEVQNFFPRPEDHPIDTAECFCYCVPGDYKYPPEQDGKANPAYLGGGAYGQVYQICFDRDSGKSSPLFACKVIPKKKYEFAEQFEDKMKHLELELSVLLFTTAAADGAPCLNKIAVDPDFLSEGPRIYHDVEFVYVPLEMTKCSKYIPRLLPGETLSSNEIREQFLHLFTRFSPGSIPDLDYYVKKQEKDPLYFSRIRDCITRLIHIKRRGCPDSIETLAGPRGNIFQLIWSYDPDPVPEVKSKIIIKQCLEAVAWLHSHNIVHRDIKPANILFGETRVCVGGTTISDNLLDIQLTDFGHAKLIASKPHANGEPHHGDDDDEPTREHAREESHCHVTGNTGTSVYSPLDVLEGRERAQLVGNTGMKRWVTTKENLKKWDVFGVGATMFCLLNGYPPAFEKEDQSRSRREVCMHKKFRESVAEADREFILWLMDDDPTKRPTAEEALNCEYLQDTVTEQSLRRLGGLSPSSTTTTTTTAGGGESNCTLTPLETLREENDIQQAKLNQEAAAANTHHGMMMTNIDYSALRRQEEEEEEDLQK